MKQLREVQQYLRSLLNASARAEKTKLARIAVVFDIIYCQIRFNVKISEYVLYKFYNYKNRYRKHFLLNYHQRKKYKRINNLRVTYSKWFFYEKMSKWFQRDAIPVPDCGERAFLDFVKKHQKVIIKPVKGTLGKGISVLNYKSEEQVLQNYLTLKDQYICEEYIGQHPVMAELYPGTVNTVRIMSIRNNEDNVELVSATLKIGAKADTVVDNMGCGGIIAQVDLETGIVSSFAIDSQRNKYSHHPVTNVQIIGMNLPNWDKVVELVKQAHNEMKESRVIGWDIAITESGAALVEANRTPSPKLMQMIDCAPKGEKIIKALNNKDFQVYKYPKKKK